MTSTGTSTRAATSAPDTLADISSATSNGPGCGMCDHALASHDAISRRYCRASEAQALIRGCICPKGN